MVEETSCEVSYPDPGGCLLSWDLILGSRCVSCTTSFSQNCDGWVLFNLLKWKARLSKMSLMKWSIIQLERRSLMLGGRLEFQARSLSSRCAGLTSLRNHSLQLNLDKMCGSLSSSPEPEILVLQWHTPSEFPWYINRNDPILTLRN